MKKAILALWNKLRLTFAMIGVGIILCSLILVFTPSLRINALSALHNWLLDRQQATLSTDAAGPLFQTKTQSLSSLPAEQARVAKWLSKKYNLQDNVMAALVANAYQLGAQYKLSPTLILAIAAIESNFHPYIQSQAGAQGLMQVMPHIHAKRFEAYGGRLSAFDPQVNMRVGVEILIDSIKLKGGSLNEGLRFYFGGDTETDSNGEGYVAKVLDEQARLDLAASGQTPPTTSP